jgi:sec-independent protein translocase protein TatA
MITCAFLGDIGGAELLVVFVAILLLFGGKQLPSIARQMSRALEQLRKASQDFKNQLMEANEELDAPPGTTVTHDEKDQAGAPLSESSEPGSPSLPEHTQKEATPRDHAG